MQCRITAHLGGILLLFACAAPGKAADLVIDIASRREPFVDGLLIERLTNARHELARPRDEGVAFRFDKPWEGTFCGYCTILLEDGRYRAYYRGLHTAGRDGSEDECTCCAESSDGTHWTKPVLGLFERMGSRDNNIVLSDAAPVSHNFCPFIDRRPQCPAGEKYKAIGGTEKSGLIAYASGDGVHWKKFREKPVFEAKGWVFDSQNLVFWSETENCYALYFRKAAGGKRAIARATSADLTHWSSTTPMIYSDTSSDVPSQHLYTNQTQPYFRAPHIYLATAARFMPGRKVISDAEATAIGVHPSYFGDTSDAVLMTSRGGAHYDCTFGDGFIRPGLGFENWVSRTNYPALNIVPTGPQEMSLYVNQNYGQPSAHLHRYSLRLDGLASIRASLGGGECLTKPLAFQGRLLLLNYATSAAGGLRIELQDQAGKPLTGFSLKDCDTVIGNEIERAVAWKGRSDVSSLAGKPVRIRFEIKDADLYALRFE